MSKAPLWIAGALVAAGLGVVLVSGVSGAGDEKAVLENIDKVAAALQKGDKDGAKKQADAVAKKLEDVVIAMDLFKVRKKDGFGVGDKPGAIMPDGIEQMLLKLGRDAPAAGTLKRDAAAYEKMGYRIAALGLVARAKGAPQLGGKKTAKDWNAWSEDTVTGGLALAAAAKALGAQEVKGAAVKLNTACNACHTVFR